MGISKPVRNPDNLSFIRISAARHKKYAIMVSILDIYNGTRFSNRLFGVMRAEHERKY